MRFSITPQPDGETCGQSCLFSVYKYYKDDITLGTVIKEIPTLDYGGTLGVVLGVHALKRGYAVTMYTYNIQMFDPTWFKGHDLQERLLAQLNAKPQKGKLRFATNWALEFLRLGGVVKNEGLTPMLLSKYLGRNIPILSGLSSTYLYQCKRETATGEVNDVSGYPAGHFVVVTEYNPETGRVSIADPYPNPSLKRHTYVTSIERLISSILLGVMTYDANILVIEKR